MQANAAAVAAIRAGDNRPTTFLIGEIMRETSGRADPALVQALVKQKLAVSVIQILSLGGAIAAQGDPSRATWWRGIPPRSCASWRPRGGSAARSPSKKGRSGGS